MSVSNAVADDTASNPGVAFALQGTSRRPSSLRLASVGEIAPESCPPESCQPDGGTTWQDSVSNATGKTLIEELYHDARSVRQQLDAKRGTLVAALQAQQQTEQTLRQALAERQSLHGEVRLLQHRISTVEADAATESEQHEEMEARCRGGERRLRDLEGRLQEAELRSAALERRGREVEVRFEAAERLREEAERRAEEAEHRAASDTQRARVLEQQLQLRAEAEVQELQARYAETDLKRQNELKTALLELRALSQGQQTLHAELRRSSRPPPVLPYVAPALRGMERIEALQSGPQRWHEAFEGMRARVAIANAHHRGLAELPVPQGSLLSGKVREQARFLDSQVSRLKERLQAQSAPLGQGQEREW